MSLSLLQDYSSAEEEAAEGQQLHYDDSSGDEPVHDAPQTRYKPLFDPNPASSSSLPSAFDAFSEISGPPEFLNNSVEEAAKNPDGQRWRHGRKIRRDKKDLPSGVIVEAKAQLVGIHERVRSDIDGNISKTPSNRDGSSSGAPEAKRVVSVNNPSAEDAAELLRMCLQCGVPKTYSNGRGITCPQCGDRPPVEIDKEAKKKGSTVKDKEKSKRMKGQSSHATWKSETEMLLRQQFD